MKLDAIRTELQERAKQHEADGRYRDAAYLYHRIMESSEVVESVRIQKILVSLYKKLGDFPAAERAQEEIVSKIALSRSNDNDTQFDVYETLSEVRNLMRLYNRFKSRIAMLNAAGGAEMCIVHRAASLDVEWLNDFLLHRNLAADDPDSIHINTMNSESKRRRMCYETIPPTTGNLRYNILDEGRKPTKGKHNMSPVYHDGLIGNDQSSPKTVEDTSDEDNERPMWGFNAFHIAAKNGAINLAELLLDKGADIEALSQEYYWTGLHFATKSTHIEMMRWLIEKGANVDAKDCVGRTALHLASSVGNTAAVRLLLENGAKTEIPAYDQMTPLHFASQRDHHNSIELLLKSGAKIDAQTSYKTTALDMALAGGNDKAAAKLLENGAKPFWTVPQGYQADTIFHDADTSGSDLFKGSLLSLPAGNMGSIDCVNQNLQTPLHCATVNGNESVVRSLLDAGADIEEKDEIRRTPLLLASENGHTAVMRLLLEQGADIDAKDEKDRTLLHLASERGNIAAVDLLLKEGVDINAKQHDESTALHLAVIYGHESLVELLLETGANIEARNIYGNTALHLAAAIDLETIAQMLIEHGANLEIRDGNQMTALHKAACFGNERMVALLLDRGAEINAQGPNGSAVYQAIVSNYEDVVRLLRQRGAACDLTEIPDKRYWELLFDITGPVQQSNTAIA